MLWHPWHSPSGDTGLSRVVLQFLPNPVAATPDTTGLSRVVLQFLLLTAATLNAFRGLPFCIRRMWREALELKIGRSPVDGDDRAADVYSHDYRVP